MATLSLSPLKVFSVSSQLIEGSRDLITATGENRDDDLGRAVGPAELIDFIFNAIVDLGLYTERFIHSDPNGLFPSIQRID